MISNTTITIVNLRERKILIKLFILAPYNRSVAQIDSTKTLITELESVPTISQHRAQSRKSASTGKGKKVKTASNVVDSKTRHTDIGKRKHAMRISNQMIFPSTGLSSKPIDKVSIPTKKYVSNTVITYRHHRGTNGDKYGTGRQTILGISNNACLCMKEIIISLWRQ